MVVKLLRAARIRHEAGEIVKVSPAEANFLISIGSATPVEEKKEVKAEAEEKAAEPKAPAKKATTKKTASKTSEKTQK